MRMWQETCYKPICGVSGPSALKDFMHTQSALLTQACLMHTTPPTFTWPVQIHPFGQLPALTDGDYKLVGAELVRISV